MMMEPQIAQFMLNKRMASALDKLDDGRGERIGVHAVF